MELRWAPIYDEGVETFLIIPERGWCSEFSHKKMEGVF